MWRLHRIVLSILVEWAWCAILPYAKLQRCRLNNQVQVGTLLLSIGRPLLIDVETSLAHSSSEGHAGKTEKTMMRCIGDSIAFFVGSFAFLVFAIGVERRDYRCIAQRVDTFDHAWYWVWILGHHSVQIAVVNTKAKSSVLVRDENYRWDPLCLRGFDNVHREHSYISCFSNSLTFEPAR